jgi:flagellar basal-body rod modification protein FlgD
MSAYDVAGLGSTSSNAPQKFGFAALGQGDFLRLMTEQMKSQDPFDPVDNKEMLAQMAQFSQLAGVSDINKTLTALGEKLDAILAAQKAAAPAAASADAPTTPAS